MSNITVLTLGSGVVYVHSDSAPWAKEAFSAASAGSQATFLRSLDQGGGHLLDKDGSELTGAGRREAINTLRSELYALEGGIRSTYEIYNRARDATFDLLRERLTIAFPTESCPYNSPVEMARALALNTADLYKHHAKLASRRGKLEKREEARAIGGATSIDGQESLEVQELEEESRQLDELEDKLERYRKFGGDLDAAVRLQRLAGTSRVRQILVELLEYSEYSIAQPRHLVSHPRPAFTDFTAFLNNLPVPLPPAAELSALADALSIRIVGPLHRLQIAFLDENNNTHIDIEQVVNVLESKTLFSPGTYLNSKEKRRRKSLIEVGNVPEHIADIIGDAMEDLAAGSETFWALQSAKARAGRSRD
ncbi:hypothetical protein RQP46_003303 [Phenoliferia psychrophenolica]